MRRLGDKQIKEQKKIVSNDGLDVLKFILKPVCSYEEDVAAINVEWPTVPLLCMYTVSVYKVDYRGAAAPKKITNHNLQRDAKRTTW